MTILGQTNLRGNGAAEWRAGKFRETSSEFSTTWRNREQGMRAVAGDLQRAFGLDETQ